MDMSKFGSCERTRLWPTLRQKLSVFLYRVRETLKPSIGMTLSQGQEWN